MVRTIVAIAGFAAFLSFGALSLHNAMAASSHSSPSASTTGHGNFHRHHRTNRFYAPYYYYGYPNGYDYSTDNPPPAVTKAPAEKPVAETRRGCEPQTYSVPGADGGESQVTILRC
jgi:hypothetical protein